jgi:hypothetical protein
MRNGRLKQQLLLGSKEIFYEAQGRNIGLDMVKLEAGSSVRIRKMSVAASWRSRPPP